MMTLTSNRRPLTCLFALSLMCLPACGEPVAEADVVGEWTCASEAVPNGEILISYRDDKTSTTTYDVSEPSDGQVIDIVYETHGTYSVSGSTLTETIDSTNLVSVKIDGVTASKAVFDLVAGELESDMSETEITPITSLTDTELVFGRGREKLVCGQQ